MSGPYPNPRTGPRSRGKEALRYLLCNTCETMWRWQSGDDVYVTCDARPQGIGSQILATLSVQLFAHKMGLNYCHSPFRSAEHAEGDIATWVQEWEKWLGLGCGSPLFTDLQDSHDVVRLDPREIFLLRKKKGRLYVLPDAHSVTDCFPDDYSLVADPVRERILKRSAQPPSDGRTRRLVVHARRGDVLPTWNVDRFTSNQTIVRLVDQCRNASPVPLEVHIYSNGRPEEFADLGAGFECHLNDDARSTFLALVEADVLIMAKSALSYVAALLSQGVVVYERFWTPPKSDWVVAEASGAIDRRVLSKALGRLNC